MAIIETPPQKVKRKHEQPEAKIQAACVAWLWNEHPETRGLFFHVENEESDGNAVKGGIRRAMGIVAGVSDMILLMPRGRYHGLCVEFKTEIGRQKPQQIEWQAKVEAQGFKYVICRSLESFKVIFKEYDNGRA